MRLILTLILTLAPFIEPQPESRDTVWIGDQFKIGYHLENVQDSSRIILPIYELDAFSDSIVVTQKWSRDTVKVRKRKGEDIDVYSVFTSLDSTTVHIPSQPLFVISPRGVIDTLMLSEATISFFPPQIDTATFVKHDVRDIIKYPITVREVLPWIFGALLLAALIALAVFLVRKFHKEATVEIHKDPAHIIALRKIDKYRSKDLWAADRQKEFYSGVTDTLREYISDRYEFGAMEMTTAEISKELKNKDLDEYLKKELLDLFTTADFIKFAKYTADDDQNAKVVPFAVKFVTDTYRVEVEQENAQQEDK